jgi:hypothetical protein
MMKAMNFIAGVLLMIWVALPAAQAQNWQEKTIHSTIDHVQPFTGIVLWTSNEAHHDSESIALEFSYMLFNEVVSDSATYDWSAVEEKLDDVASRNHQVVFRFRFVYPGHQTSVPDYIKEMDDYNETEGITEGQTTWFPDWTHSELKHFTLEFYRRFAERYDQDPRLAYVQVGFGLWGEYHIYDGPFYLGETFPSKEFQKSFFYHLDSVFQKTTWSISIDAADDTYSPFAANPDLKKLKFGLFDDSFMHENHAGYNTDCWNFFGRDRYQRAPAGGEFSYYSQYDQEHVLDPVEGPYGKPYETFARDFHITYINGNDQPRYQSMERIREASMASGYRFRIESYRAAADTSVFEISNIGVAPIYFDAYISVDGMRSSKNLRNLQPGETQTYGVGAAGPDSTVRIECDRLLKGQEIEFMGNQAVDNKALKGFDDLGVELHGSKLVIDDQVSLTPLSLEVFNLLGRQIFQLETRRHVIPLAATPMEPGIYIVRVERKDPYACQTRKILWTR